MTTHFKVNENVEWKWLGRKIQGQVKEIFPRKVTRKIKGKEITRNGSKEVPAYLVESSSGNLALKLESELMTASVVSGRAKPKMFQK